MWREGGARAGGGEGLGKKGRGGLIGCIIRQLTLPESLRGTLYGQTVDIIEREGKVRTGGRVRTKGGVDESGREV